MTHEEKDEALRKTFDPRFDSDPLTVRIRQIVLHVQDCCAKRAEFGDFMTGMGCRDGYLQNGEIGRARKKAADDIRALRWDRTP